MEPALVDRPLLGELGGWFDPHLPVVYPYRGDSRIAFLPVVK